MCGIIGYTGTASAVDVLIEGLATLEYRGYDSAGVAVVTGNGDPRVRVVKRAGKLANLREMLEGTWLDGTTGVGHTRWATHGEPSDRNSHPHQDADGDLAIIHNGIFENFAELRAGLAADGHEFASDTDTEVIAHLIGRSYDDAGVGGDGADGAVALAGAVRTALRRVEGAFAIAVVDRRSPDTIVASRREAPLVLGHLDGASLLSSDVAGLIRYTRDVEALLDDQVAILTPEGITVTDLDGNTTEGHRYTVDWDIDVAEKQGYPHFMLKEIHEQPGALHETLLGRTRDGRIVLDEQRLDDDDFRHLDKVYVVACGTSYHAGMVAKYALEHWARVPVEVEIASEFRYRDPILTQHTLVVAISQSGETADTLAAAAHARAQRARVVAISNVVGSSLAREADAVLYTRAGPEIAVASTKAFTTQILALELLALFLAQLRRAMFPDEWRDQLRRMETLPDLMEQVFGQETAIRQLAASVAHASYVMFIGRQVGLPIALEGALKLKEISYLHAEGFPAGEMKHGPIALIEQGGPVVALATAGHVRGKIVSNIAEVKARGAMVVAIATEGDTEIKAHADHVIYVPDVHELLYPMLTVVPLQLLAYFIATELGCDVDQPRNLAKTVTVE
ncbi:MAG: glutamine--fructose-6-phosphate transaminase (isomerizing) [Actinobacteria bacterium]|nr:glutamine--fructose-6-phosphate transaminase (isomerizing) [Actinomycetota bacterium]